MKKGASWTYDTPSGYHVKRDTTKKHGANHCAMPQ